MKITKAQIMALIFATYSATALSSENPFNRTQNASGVSSSEIAVMQSELQELQAAMKTLYQKQSGAPAIGQSEDKAENKEFKSSPVAFIEIGSKHYLKFAGQNGAPVYRQVKKEAYLAAKEGQTTSLKSGGDI